MTIEAAELITRVRADLSGLEREMSRAETILQNAAKGMETQGRQAGRAFSAGMGSEMQQGLEMLLGPGARMLLGGAIVGGLGFIGGQIAQTVGELNELGLRSDRLGTAFVTLWGEQAPRAMERMRQASLGAISDIDLQLAANRAAMLQVTQDVDELAGLLEVAQARGRAMGISSAQAFDRIITGIGRIAPLILDDLGIITDAENTYAAFATKLGKTAAELTAVEQRQALVNRVLEMGGDVTLDAAGKAEALAAAQMNLRTEIGLTVKEMIEESGIGETLTKTYDDMAASIRDARKAREEFRAGRLESEAWQYGQAALERLRTTPRESRRYEDMEARYRQIEHLEVRLSMLDAQLRRNIITEEEYDRLVREAVDSVLQWAGLVSQAEIAALNKAEAVLRAGRAMRAAELAGNDLNEEVRDFAAEAAWATERANAFAASLRGAVMAAGGLANAMQTQRFFDALGLPEPVSTAPIEGAPGEGYGPRWDFGRRHVENLRRGNEVLVDLRRKELDNAGRHYSDAERLAEQHYQNMRSMVEGHLNLTAVTREDMLATQLGLYQDKPDEYLRRLRSAVQDEQSLWKDLLGGRAGAEAEYYLMQQERLFQQGRWGEMGPGFDRGAAVEAIVASIQAQIAAEQTRAALVDEIMRHPGLAGAGLRREQVAEMVGLPTDYEALGIERGQALSRGLSAAGVGVAFTTDFEQEFVATRERWVSMGALSVTWLAQGIQRGVTPDVAMLLVSLLAPRVEEALAGGRRP